MFSFGDLSPSLWKPKLVSALDEGEREKVYQVLQTIKELSLTPKAFEELCRVLPNTLYYKSDYEAEKLIATKKVSEMRAMCCRLGDNFDCERKLHRALWELTRDNDDLFDYASLCLRDEKDYWEDGVRCLWFAYKAGNSSAKNFLVHLFNGEEKVPTVDEADEKLADGDKPDAETADDRTVKKILAMVTENPKIVDYLIPDK